MAHRLTIRIEDQTWDEFAAFAHQQGVSMTGFIQASIENWLLAWNNNGRIPVEIWDEDTYGKRAYTVTLDARRVDAERRRRVVEPNRHRRLTDQP